MKTTLAFFSLGILSGLSLGTISHFGEYDFTSARAGYWIGSATMLLWIFVHQIILPPKEKE